ncbi:N-acetylglucosamine-1-phosphodiester alpha-N-acetylglucosaminidase isoform X2 [Varanus komodoensis]|uniref:N-acetylglucosamine-1-phosphodiester alpha-N-acetylglucosaminidase isoform X2 n=1 Tax=Varanus komodoensis TaxID=61221 RepID=UPI001CF7914B|nr:N-acetylglucosamine-1-phosphodiester alpha-N-acetylglucosaminidase isoform X2 [Varanus komodoensis]
MAASVARPLRAAGRLQKPAAWPVFFLVLLRCLWGVLGTPAVRNSLNDDLLLPYSPPQHGPQHLRDIRDCQALLAGNAAHESWPADNSSVFPLAITSSFVSYFPPQDQNSRQVYGHLTVARAPLRTFSVLEPGGPGGCRSRSRGTVEETARLTKCLVAQNGGYFDMDTGECFGNIVSDGHLVQTSGGVQNAQFGIRKDGTLVFGYLSKEEVLAKENPFVQLVSGVVWLLRDGEVYINQSRAVECDETQKTGTFDRFINTVSARTAVGHDRQGRLVLLHVDGQTDARGLSLWEMADFLQQHGVVNAINLDGGGSATLVLNGTLASYPSDHCASNPMWRCPRKISTAICIHEPVCWPPDCSGHGRCVLGQCQCSGGFWSGPACDVLDCGPSNCTLHGMCTEMGCLCDAGWMGANCSEACTLGTYGDGCAQKCLCRNGGTCNPMNGSCGCAEGFRGTLCDDAAQCLLKAQQEESLFSWKAWIVICVLLQLLLVSVLVNIRLCRGSFGRHGRSRYAYHPLEEINGDTTDRCLPAKEDHTEEAWDPNQTERDVFLS